MQPEITLEDLQDKRDQAARNIRNVSLTYNLMPRAVQEVMDTLDDTDKLSGLTMLERGKALEFFDILKHVGFYHCTYVESVVSMCKPAVDKVLKGESLANGKNIDLHPSTASGRINFGEGLYAAMTEEKLINMATYV